MKKVIYIVLISWFFGGMCINTNAQTLKNYVKQRNQELAERQRMEKSNYEKACNDGSLAAYNEYLSMYPNGKYVQDIKTRIAAIEKKIEQEYYKKVCNQGTIQAYNDYIKKYPNGNYVQEAKGRIEDMELWQKAKYTNTIDAYRHYLNFSKNKSFAQLANDAISDLESKEAWNNIRNSMSKSTVENFIAKYPKSSCLSEAQKRLDEILATEYYEQGDFQRALEKFDSAGGRYLIDPSNRSKYDVCREYIDYIKLNPTSKESDLLAFLNKYPSSKYYNKVSNMVAIEKAKKLSMYASTQSFNEALSYAKDNTTQNTVQSYINQAKRSYSQYKKRQRHNRIMANGGYVKFGLEVFDMGVSLDTEYEDMTIYYYNVGLSIKLGNYKAPIQFEVGIKPGVIVMDDGYYDETESSFHMPVYAKLKLNLCELWNGKFYAAGIGAYNAIKDEYLENEYSVGGGVGLAWKKWDLFLYYKQGIENKLNIDDKYIGTSLIYYF